MANISNPVPRDPSFSSVQLEKICRVIGDTNNGLTGTEIGRVLAQKYIPDINPDATKWIRLFNALAEQQNKQSCGNCVLSVIAAAMEPIRYVGKSDLFEHQREELNAVLAFCGLQLRTDGKFSRASTATTLEEAEGRANRLRAELKRRGVHPDVIHFCQAEWLQSNCFHAVFEATKSIAEKLRNRTGLTTDGARLVDEALSGNSPRIAINSLQTETERSEQAGFGNLVKGVFGTFRNVTAHAPKVTWPIDEADALDLFSVASYVHRRIDKGKLPGS